ncbi:MAG: ferric reductase-like transmembrane domain-containing protein [Actinomycetota bacterium]
MLAPLVLVGAVRLWPRPSFAVALAAGLGFAALAMLALQAVLPSRAGPITAPFGIERLLGFHRVAGILVLILVVGHVVVLVAEDPAKLWLFDSLHAPWRARAAALSLVALLALTATSLWRRGMRLAYERWRGLHLALAAVALLAGVIHALLVGRYLSVATLRVAVALLAVAAVAGMVWLRVARPLAASRLPYRIREVRPERGHATTLVLEADGHGGRPFRPGQFAWLKLADAPLSLREHPFSYVSSAHRPARPAFTIKALGDFTSAVPALRPGQSVLVDGPHGGYRLDRHAPGHILVAGGVGITPVMSMLRTLDEDGGDAPPMLLVYGSGDWESVTFREELADLERRLPLRVVHVLLDPPPAWTGETGLVDPALLARVAPAGARDWHAFVCGPPGLVRAAADALTALGLPHERIHLERFVAA